MQLCLAESEVEHLATNCYFISTNHIRNDSPEVHLPLSQNRSILSYIMVSTQPGVAHKLSEVLSLTFVASRNWLSKSASL